MAMSGPSKLYQFTIATTSFPLKCILFLFAKSPYNRGPMQIRRPHRLAAPPFLS